MTAFRFTLFFTIHCISYFQHTFAAHMYAAALIFKICFIAVLYTYIFYPLLLKILSLFKRPSIIFFDKKDELPPVSIIIAAHNEEKVIEEKLDSILKSDYPLSKIEVLVGSDLSTDTTNEIVKSFSLKNENVSLIPFTVRSGKVKIINDLVKRSKYDILILTDANVMFDRTTIYELVKHYKNPGTGLVDSRMINTGIKKDGISLQEKSYIQTEVYIKYYEGLLWGTMMGPFGGCYSLRKRLFTEVPSHFLVDDFYINMSALLRGGKCINELNAKVYEDVSNIARIEFRRKIRIAAGSFQNLFHFFPVLFRFDKVSFCFFSHKVLRWLGPFLMLVFYLSAIYLISDPFYLLVVIVSTLIFISPFLDYFLKNLFSIHLSPLRFLSHFTTTNAAQVAGFFKYVAGIRSGIWEPTRRKQ